MSDLSKNMLLCLGDKKVRVLSVDGDRVLVIDFAEAEIKRVASKNTKEGLAIIGVGIVIAIFVIRWIFF